MDVNMFTKYEPNQFFLTVVQEKRNEFIET